MPGSSNLSWRRYDHCLFKTGKLFYFCRFSKLTQAFHKPIGGAAEYWADQTLVKMMRSCEARDYLGILLKEKIFWRVTIVTFFVNRMYTC